MPPAASDSTTNLCSGELKHARMCWFQVSVGKSLLYIQNMNAMERIIEMLDILGPNIFLTFHYCVLTGPLWLSIIVFWTRVNNLIVRCCLLGTRTWLPPIPGVINLCPGVILPLWNYPSCRTGLADLIFIWMSYSCGRSLSMICLRPYHVRVI